ncbi:nicotinamide riboside kinase 1 isoform X1 [Lepisosteus oculatus]|uniref:nicotinamide riboside kinase 1 isoform X1 n=1 Tax=Lepisosteus oculatus TaxID=7918 RepID=UPI0037114FB7
MRQIIIGIGGVTNGGKTTLANKVYEHIPNTFIISQDKYFKDESLVAVDSSGFKQYDVIDALDMDSMMLDIESWRKDPRSFLKINELKNPPNFKDSTEVRDDVYILIIEGFLLFNYKPLNDLFDRRYYLQVPYEVCKKRRCTRVYVPPDPPGYFDGHVWPMYVKNRKEMEATGSALIYLDGTKMRDELFSIVHEEIMIEIQKLAGKTLEND